MQMHSSLELEGRRQNGRARVLTSPTESSVAIPEDQEEGGSRCAVFALAAETERSERLLTPPPCKHADSFALLLVLSNPKHRFGFERKNEEADMEFSASAGNEMQRVHSDVGKKWGNRFGPRFATHGTSSVTLRVPPSPQVNAE